MSPQQARARKPALVILAAGESRRLGQCKALVPIAPECPLELLVRAGACLDDAPPLVIAGADRDAIARALPSGAEIAFNPQWAASRTAGVRVAAELRPGFDLCVAPVDVPLVPSAVFESLLAAWRERGAPSRGWLAPSYAPPSAPENLSHGHPIVIGHDLAPALAALEPDAPLRALRAMADPVWSVAVLDDAILDDLDTPEDLARMRAKMRS
jgi:CTP:molybdopterin cytidylyltransferase MocA